ncbi:MAG TPA: hypothetical protein VGA16_01540 [Candidatus Limnocylindria bacterium]
MRELLEGRRIGFALRPPLASIAVGLGIAVTLLDLMAWFGWGARVTNGIVVAALWLTTAAAIVALLGAATALVELIDIPDDDRSIARLDVIAVLVAAALYVASAVIRALETGAIAGPAAIPSGASPVAVLLAVAALIVLFAGAAMSSLLYASREWEEIEEIAHERHRRRRTAS